MRIDESWSHNQARRIDDTGCANVRGLAEENNPVATDAHVLGLRRRTGAIQDGSIFDQNIQYLRVQRRGKQSGAKGADAKDDRPHKTYPSPRHAHRQAPPA